MGEEGSLDDVVVRQKFVREVDDDVNGQHRLDIDETRDAGSGAFIRRRELTMAGAATDWISLAEAADILGASNVHFRAATIGSWARTGKIQSIKLGGRRFVRRGEVRALIAGPRRVRADQLQPGLFEDLGD